MDHVSSRRLSLVESWLRQGRLMGYRSTWVVECRPDFAERPDAEVEAGAGVDADVGAELSSNIGVVPVLAGRHMAKFGTSCRRNKSQ